MTKKEYIESNQYLRKWMQNLTKEDLQIITDIWLWKINPLSKENIVKIKQVVYHMQKWMSLWEMRWLIKAFKTLEKLPN
jgi:hypothetical protein